MFNLSAIYSECKSSNHKLSKNQNKISPDPNPHKKYFKKHTHNQSIHKHQTQNFQRISPFGTAPVKKKHIRLGHAGIVNHSVNLSIPDF